MQVSLGLSPNTDNVWTQLGGDGDVSVGLHYEKRGLHLSNGAKPTCVFGGDQAKNRQLTPSKTGTCSLAVKPGECLLNLMGVSNFR